MTARTELPGAGKASRCEVTIYHRPKPLRFVWHHIVPEAYGGKTEPGNLVQTCDNDHYSVHRIMWLLANGGIPPGMGSRAQRSLAERGYQAAVAAGTADRIPREG